MADADLPAIPTNEVAAVALALTDEEALEAFVDALPSEKVAPFLAALVNAKTNITALTKGLEQRLMADGKTGAHFTVAGIEYGFYGAQAKGWKDIPSLFANLAQLGIAGPDLAGAVSEVRVTDLRKAATFLSKDDNREQALALIEEGRFDKGERGTPSFKIVQEPMKVKVTKWAK